MLLACYRIQCPLSRAPRPATGGLIGCVLAPAPAPAKAEATQDVVSYRVRSIGDAYVHDIKLAYVTEHDGWVSGIASCGFALRWERRDGGIPSRLRLNAELVGQWWAIDCTFCREGLLGP